MEYIDKFLIIIGLLIVSIFFVCGSLNFFTFSHVYSFWKKLILYLGIIIIVCLIFILYHYYSFIFNLPLIESFKFYHNKNEKVINPDFNINKNIKIKDIIKREKRIFEYDINKYSDTNWQNGLIGFLSNYCRRNNVNKIKFYEKILFYNVFVNTKKNELDLFEEYIDFHLKISGLKTKKNLFLNNIFDLNLISKLDRRNLTLDIHDLSTSMISGYLKAKYNSFDVGPQNFYDTENQFRTESDLYGFSFMRNKKTNNLNDFLLDSEYQDEGFSPTHKKVLFYRNLFETNREKTENFEELESENFKQNIKYYKALLDEKKFGNENLLAKFGYINTLPSNNLNEDIKIINNDYFRNTNKEYEFEYLHRNSNNNISSDFDLEKEYDSLDSKSNLNKYNVKVNNQILNKNTIYEENQNKKEESPEIKFKRLNINSQGQSNLDEYYSINKIKEEKDFFKKSKTNFKNKQNIINLNRINENSDSQFLKNSESIQNIDFKFHKNTNNIIMKKMQNFNSIKEDTSEDHSEFKKDYVGLKQFDKEILNKHIIKSKLKTSKNNLNSIFIENLLKNKLKTVKSERPKSEKKYFEECKEIEDSNSNLKECKKVNFDLEKNEIIFTSKHKNIYQKQWDQIKDREILKNKNLNKTRNHFLQLKKMKSSNIFDNKNCNLRNLESKWFGFLRKDNQISPIKKSSFLNIKNSTYISLNSNKMNANDKQTTIFEIDEVNNLKKESKEFASRVFREQLILMFKKSKTNLNKDQDSGYDNTKPHSMNNLINQLSIFKDTQEKSSELIHKKIGLGPIKKIIIKNNKCNKLSKESYMNSKSKTNEADIRCKNNKYSNYLKLNKFQNFEIEEILNEEK